MEEGILIRNAIKGVPRTALLVSAFRAILTNAYFKNTWDSIKRDQDSELNATEIIAKSTSHPYYRIQKEFINNYVPTLRVDGVNESLGIYDPYAYYFATHPLAVELLINSLGDNVRNERGMLGEENSTTIQLLNSQVEDPLDGIREMVNNSHPLEAWKMYCPSGGSMKRVGKRTLLIDHQLYKHVIEPGKQAQVVILGCGLDCRSLRLPFSDKVSVFEIDLPEMIEFKQLILSQAKLIIPTVSKSKNSYFSADLSNQDIWPQKLMERGFNPSIPTFWLAEGLFMYLPTGAPEKLVSTIYSLSAPNSYIHYHTALDEGHVLLSPTSLEATVLPMILHKTSNPAELSTAAGFQYIETLHYQDIDKQFNITDVTSNNEYLSQYSLARKQS